MKKTIYKIHVKGWDKHNGGIKRGHKKILLSTSFLSDAKIRALTPVTRLLYLSCLLVAGESTQSQIEVSHESLVFQSGVKSQSLQSQLDLLQSLQLVTYEKIEPLINRIEKKRKEKKGIEENRKEGKGLEKIPEKAEPEKNDPEKNLAVKMPAAPHQLILLWNSYRGLLPEVKKSNPTRDRKINSVWKKLNEAEWVEVIKKLSESDFCCGKNDRGWKADFDFLVKPETYSRALEGRYDNRASHQYGMTDDGRYLTQTVKRSHNNKVMIDKYLRGVETDEEQLENVSSSSTDC